MTTNDKNKEENTGDVGGYFVSGFREGGQRFC